MLAVVMATPRMPLASGGRVLILEGEGGRKGGWIDERDEEGGGKGGGELVELSTCLSAARRMTLKVPPALTDKTCQQKREEEGGSNGYQHGAPSLSSYAHVISLFSRASRTILTLRNASNECGPFFPSTRWATAMPAQLTTTFTVWPHWVEAWSRPAETRELSRTWGEWLRGRKEDGRRVT